MATDLEPGVYRNATGHTITINKHHPEDAGLPEGYVLLGSEEEFAKGEFHPYLLPGDVPEGWTPQSATASQWQPAGSGGGLTQDDVDAAVKKAVAEADKKTKALIDAAVAKAVEAATK